MVVKTSDSDMSEHQGGGRGDKLKLEAVTSLRDAATFADKTFMVRDVTNFRSSLSADPK